jgi:hypothetical protein
MPATKPDPAAGRRADVTAGNQTVMAVARLLATNEADRVTWEMADSPGQLAVAEPVTLFTWLLGT